MGLHTGLIFGLIVTGTDMPSLLLPGLLIKSDLGVDPTRSMGRRDSLLNERKKMWVDFRI